MLRNREYLLLAHRGSIIRLCEWDYRAPRGIRNSAGKEYRMLRIREYLLLAHRGSIIRLCEWE